MKSSLSLQFVKTCPSRKKNFTHFSGFAKVHLQHHENEAAQGDEVRSGRSHHVMLLKAMPYFDVHQIHDRICNYTYMLSS